jgi:hypothetical protein
LRTRSADTQLLKQEALARTSKLLALQEMRRKLAARLDEITAELPHARYPPRAASASSWS